MKYLNFFLLCVFGVAFCFMSCNKEESSSTTEEQPEAVPLSIHTNMIEEQTRNYVLKEEFIPGDKIGLFILKDGTHDIYTNGDFKGEHIPAIYSDRYIWEQDVFLTDEKVNVFAFYPCTDYLTPWGGFSFIFTMGSNNQQVMYGTHAKGTLSYADRNNSSVQLEMKHMLGIAEFFFRTDPEYPKAGKLTEIELYNRDMPSGPIPSDVVVNIVTGEITTYGSEHPVVVRKTDGDKILEHISNSFPTKGVAVPIYTTYATKSKGEIMARLHIDGRNYLWELPVGTEWKSGYRYRYYITVVGGSLSLESVTIEAPKDGGNKDVELQ